MGFVTLNTERPKGEKSILRSRLVQPTFISFCQVQVYLQRISCCCCSCCRPTSAAAEREPSSVALAAGTRAHVENRASARVLRSHYCQDRDGLARSSFAIARARV